MPNVVNPFASEEITPPFSEEWQAKRRVAAAIRHLTEVLVTSSPDVEQMHEIATKLEATAKEFGASPRIYGRVDWTISGEHGSFGQISHELNPLAGHSNPVAPPINSWIEDGRAYGTWRLQAHGQVAQLLQRPVGRERPNAGAADTV